MYYPSYNPFYMQNRNYYKRNVAMQNITQTTIQDEKKDTESPNGDTISFQDFYPNNISKTSTQTENSTSQSNNKSRLFSFSHDKISILGFDLEIDDLIILALIFLLLRDFNENYALIIILGLILLNVNLSDVLNLF